VSARSEARGTRPAGIGFRFRMPVRSQKAAPVGRVARFTRIAGSAGAAVRSEAEGAQ